MSNKEFYKLLNDYYNFNNYLNDIKCECEFCKKHRKYIDELFNFFQLKKNFINLFLLYVLTALEVFEFGTQNIIIKEDEIQDKDLLNTFKFHLRFPEEEKLDNYFIVNKHGYLSFKGNSNIM